MHGNPLGNVPRGEMAAVLNVDGFPNCPPQGTPGCAPTSRIGVLVSLPPAIWQVQDGHRVVLCIFLYGVQLGSCHLFEFSVYFFSCQQPHRILYAFVFGWGSWALIYLQELFIHEMNSGS